VLAFAAPTDAASTNPVKASVFIVKRFILLLHEWDVELAKAKYVVADGDFYSIKWTLNQ
jgi:hypothetical protein